jgi:hypothetical protein
MHRKSKIPTLIKIWENLSDVKWRENFKKLNPLFYKKKLISKNGVSIFEKKETFE